MILKLKDPTWNIKADMTSLRKAWQEFADVTTLHGVRGTSASGSSGVRRVLWVSLLGVFIAFYVFLAATTILEFYK